MEREKGKSKSQEEAIPLESVRSEARGGSKSRPWKDTPLERLWAKEGGPDGAAVGSPLLVVKAF